MTLINSVGLAAGILTTLAFLPQVLKTWKSRSAKEISLSWLVTFMSGVSLWLFYGVLIASVPVILANGMTLGLTAVILLLKVYFR